MESSILGVIIPGLGYVVNNHGDRFRPQGLGVVKHPFQMAELYGFFSNRGDPNNLYTYWDDPPSRWWWL